MRKHLLAIIVVVATAGGPAAALPNFDAPITDAVPMTIGTDYPSGKGFGALCTASGNVTVAFAGSGSIAVPVAVGFQSYPFSVTRVSASTATCTYYELR